jgi:hypothetical protein
MPFLPSKKILKKKISIQHFFAENCRSIFLLLTSLTTKVFYKYLMETKNEKNQLKKSQLLIQRKSRLNDRSQNDFAVSNVRRQTESNKQKTHL